MLKIPNIFYVSSKFSIKPYPIHFPLTLSPKKSSWHIIKLKSVDFGTLPLQLFLYQILKTLYKFSKVSISLKDIFPVFNKWYTEGRYKEKQPNRDEFCKELDNRFGKRTKETHQKWIGISLQL